MALRALTAAVALVLLALAGLPVAPAGATDPVHNNVTATLTVQGTLKYADSSYSGSVTDQERGGYGEPTKVHPRRQPEHLHPIRRAKVEIWDQDDCVLCKDDKLGVTYTDDNGRFSVSGIKNDDDNGQDLYIKFQAWGHAGEVSSGGALAEAYRLRTAPQWNVADGSTTTIDACACYPQEWQSKDVSEEAVTASAAFAVYDVIVTGHAYMHRLAGGNAELNKLVDFVGVDFPEDKTEYQTFPFYNTINLERGDWDDWDLILHEYGHHINYRFDLADLWLGLGVSWKHSPADNLSETDGRSKEQGTRLAWSEGLANYHSIAAQRVIGIPDHLDYTAHAFPWKEQTGGAPDTNYSAKDLETSNPKVDGEDNEMAVARILWDLADDKNDPGDTVSLGHVKLFQILDSGSPPKRLEDLSHKLMATDQAVAKRAQYGAIFEEHGVAPDPQGPQTVEFGKARPSPGSAAAVAKQ